MQQLYVFLLVLAVPLAVGVYFAVKPMLVRRRRERLRNQPLADGVEDILKRRVGLYPAAPNYLEPDPDADLELVMGFARLSPESIREGVGILADVLGALR